MSSMSDDQFVCPLCGASTGRFADVASHVRVAHDGSSIADVLQEPACARH